jgi:hypothetical protein
MNPLALKIVTGIIRKGEVIVDGKDKKITIEIPVENKSARKQKVSV